MKNNVVSIIKSADFNQKNQLQLKKQDLQNKIIQTLSKHLNHDAIIFSQIENLVLARSAQPKPPQHVIHDPSLCIIAQGAKKMMIGNQSYHYDPNSFLLITQTLPAAGVILEASEETPYLGMLFILDRQEVANIVLSLQMEYEDCFELGDKKEAKTSVYAQEYSLELLEAIYRLVQLLNSPKDIEFMAPLIKREIIYRLLQTNAGAVLSQMVVADSHNSRISKVISLIRERFEQPLSLSDLAKHVHMSVSSLQYHFKAITQMTPLQFQKHIRLHEAKRIMITEFVGAATAGLRVGYNNQSQFNREYRRLFGSPPSRDVKQVKSDQ